MIVIATVYEYDYKATVVYIRHMNIITSVWLLLPCPWPFNLPNPGMQMLLVPYYNSMRYNMMTPPLSSPTGGFHDFHHSCYVPEDDQSDSELLILEYFIHNFVDIYHRISTRDSTSTQDSIVDKVYSLIKGGETCKISKL